MTRKLYYEDSHMRSFDATVLSCAKSGNKYAVTLDKTAFFPEGGGQSADMGLIGDIAVCDVQITGGEIVHYTLSPLAVGDTVKCSIDWDTRFKRMQNHSGEHILSGILHSMFRCDNVGFHMGHDAVTVDFNVELSTEDLTKAELAANRAIFENVPVTAFFPSNAELKKLDYRSKLELSDDVRIVKIGEYDMCACCAPHVSHTGEIGMLKITSSMRHRGGTRITMLCGIDAFLDYRNKYDSNARISSLLSAKPDETANAVLRMLEEVKNLKNHIFTLKNDMITAYMQNIGDGGSRYVCVFCPSLDTDSMRLLVNRVLETRSAVCAAFSGKDGEGYKYIIGSNTDDMTVFAAQLNSALAGRGGGTSKMVQGALKATRDAIENYFGGKA